MFSRLKVNSVYTNQDINVIFGCSLYGGIRDSKKTKSIVLVTDHQRPNPYQDEMVSSNEIIYTGSGQKGDQLITDGNKNGKVCRSKELGLRLFYFEKKRVNEYKFIGEVEYCTHTFEIEKDVDGLDRKVIKFKLLIKETNFLINEDTLKELISQREKEVKKIDIEDLAYEVTSEDWDEVAKLLHVRSIQRERNAKVKRYTLERANGVCDLCGKEAPFNKEDGTPYLEVHHLEHLSKNGPDAIYNTVALCPNCHRKLHVLEMKSDYEVLFDKITEYLESDPLITPEKRVSLLEKHLLIHRKI